MSLGKRLISTSAGGAATCTTDSVQPFGADSTYSSNIALYQLDGNDDDTTGNFSGSSESYVTYSSTGAKFGQAATFNGSSSYIALSGNPINGQSNISISFWIKPDDVSSDQYVITFVNSDGGWNGFGIRISSSSKINVVRANSGTVTSSENSTATLSTGSWKHIVVTSSQSEVKIYIDGGLDSTHSISGFTTNNTGEYNIGALKNAGSYQQFYDGVLDQVRVFNKVISSQDVATLYAETSSTASNTNPLSEGAGVALWSLNFDASESSGYFDGTSTDVDFGVSGNINFGARFNGSSAFIDLGDANQFENNKITFSFWCRALGTAAQQQIFAEYTGGALQSGELVIRRESDEKLTVGISNGSNYLFKSTDSAVLTTTFKHFVVVIDTTQSTDDKIKIYVNNVFSASTNISSSGTVTGNVLTRSSHLFIGKRNVSAFQYFNGDLDQIRLFSKTLDTNEISQLFAETACVYTPTTNQHLAGCLANYNLDNKATESLGTSTYDLTQTDIEYRFGRFGQAAVFNGSTSNLFNSDRTATATDTISLSAWIRTSDSSSSMQIIQTESLWLRANQVWRIDNYNGTGAYKRYDYTQSIIATGNWVHLCVVRNGTSVTLYVNGYPIAFESETTNSNSSTYDGISIGARNRTSDSSKTNIFNGEIDQVRLFTSALSSSQVLELYNEKGETDTSNFKAVIYTGSSSKQYISNVGFSLDVGNSGDGGYVWIKQRTSPSRHNRNYDTVRGVYPMYSSLANLEATSNPIEYDANGFFFDGGESGVNENAEDYVAWVWRAGGDAVNVGVNTITGSTPSIASDVSANTTAGFSIVKATFNTSSPQTVAHGLLSAPEVIFSKRVSGSSVSSGDWNLYHKFIDSSYPENYFIKLNARDGRSDNAIYWNDTAPTSDVFTTGSIYDQNETVIFYCWHSVNGYSKIGTYEGNGTSDNKIYTTDDGTSTGSNGFKPSFVMLKNVDRSNTGWLIHDTARDPVNTSFRTLRAESDQTEYTSTSYWLMDFESDGFRLKYGADNEFNKLDETFIFMAFK